MLRPNAIWHLRVLSAVQEVHSCHCIFLFLLRGLVDAYKWMPVKLTLRQQPLATIATIDRPHAMPVYSHKFWSLRMVVVLRCRLEYALGGQNIHSADNDDGGYAMLAHNISLCTAARSAPTTRFCFSECYTNKDLLLEPPYHCADGEANYIITYCAIASLCRVWIFRIDIMWCNRPCVNT